VFHSARWKSSLQLLLVLRPGFRNVIALMINLGCAMNINRSLLMPKAIEIDRKIKELKVMSNGLRHTACRTESYLQCPKFSAFWGPLQQKHSILRIPALPTS
jgi:hypothetical protein